VRLTPIEAGGICLALMGVHVAARAWRIQWLLRGLGERVRLRDALVLNAFGDAACAVTPMRLGGEPARLAGMLRSGVPAAAAFVAIGYEVLAAWPVNVAVAAWLALRYAPAWWETMGSRFLARATDGWPWVAAVAVASLIAFVLARRVVRPGARSLERPVMRVRAFWRRMPLWPLVASVPMTFLELVTRVAILPVLALTLSDPPPAGPLWLGSFALLYSQLVLPTPSGAGAVELGFLGGAVGRLGPDQELLLLAWRFYTTGLGVALGAALAVRIYGWGLVRRVLPVRAARG
jgi:uncharacterized membrane protein YbhN (UPF0104 family)